MKKFEDMGLSPSLIDATKRLGFTNPTEIQEKSIPPIMAGKDVIGKSATGSGKTFAFGCGIFERLEFNQKVQALVVTPTRELTQQVRDELGKIARKKDINIVAIYGGVGIKPQMKDLNRADIVVATPGRLLDHMERGTINTSNIKILVLDEADRMFDMGFIDDIRKIIQACPKERQTLLFSATISERVRGLSKRYMNSPVEAKGEDMVDPTKLQQVYYGTQENLKLTLLANLLRREKSGLIMVFCNTRRATDFVAKTLKSNGVSAIGIHGGLTQSRRSRTMDMFNGAKVGVLVCTDVAARGLHIEDVSHVYNYNVPKDPNDYVHRIGRTARAGKNGKVVNLLSNADNHSFSSIRREYPEFKIERKEVPELERIQVAKVEKKFYKSKFKPRGRKFHR